MINDYNKEILEIKLQCINKLFTIPPLGYNYTMQQHYNFQSMEEMTFQHI